MLTERFYFYPYFLDLCNVTSRFKLDLGPLTVITFQMHAQWDCVNGGFDPGYCRGRNGTWEQCMPRPGNISR